MPSCNSPKYKLQVHHIKRWADVAHARYDVSNGIVLCWYCHKKVTGSESLYAPILQKLVAEKMPARASIISALILSRYANEQEDSEQEGS